MRMHWGTTLAFAVLSYAAAARTAEAQSEGALRAAFEGRTITMRIDMPATSMGVDVYPQDAMPVNFRDVADRLKQNGTAIKTGQSVMVTKVVVKKSHLEFQLGGGGYGTFGDWATNGTDVTAVDAGETPQERALRDAIKSASGDDRKRMQRELDALRSARERENRRATAEAQQANLAREASIRGKRLESGSRFNVRYRTGMPPEALTPDGVMRALASYADFGVLASNGAASTVASSGAPATLAMATSAPGAAGAAIPARGFAPGAASAAAASPAALRKGMTLAEVEALYGPAATASEAKDGSMTVAKRSYRTESAQVSASFVGGVLVDYAITPR